MLYMHDQHHLAVVGEEPSFPVDLRLKLFSQSIGLIAIIVSLLTVTVGLFVVMVACLPTAVLIYVKILI